MSEFDNTFEGVLFGAEFAEMQRKLADSIKCFEMKVSEYLHELEKK